MNKNEIIKVLRSCGINYRTKTTAHYTTILIKLIDLWTGKKHYYQFFYDITSIKDEYDLILSIDEFIRTKIVSFENEDTYDYIFKKYKIAIR